MRTHDEASTLLLIQLFPDICDLLLKCLARKLELEYFNFLIWALRFLISPNTIDQVHLNSDEARTVFPF